MGNTPKTYQYEEFIQWTATPEPLRPKDLKQAKDFSAKHNVSEKTLSLWKREPEFWDKVRICLKEWAKERTPNVSAALYARILRNGDPQAIKLWLQAFEGFVEKLDTEETKRIIFEVPTAQQEQIAAAFNNFGLLNTNDALKQKSIKRVAKIKTVKTRSR